MGEDVKHKTLNAQLRGCDPAVRDAILDEDSQAHAIRQAYALGKLSFGQELVGSAYSRRADDTFVPIVPQGSNRKLVRAMLSGEKTQAELVVITGQTMNTVKTKLRVLQGLGAAEHRSNGKDWVFFLTGAGKAVLEANRVSPLRVGG